MQGQRCYFQRKSEVVGSPEDTGMGVRDPGRPDPFLARGKGVTGIRPPFFKCPSGGVADRGRDCRRTLLEG